MTMKRWWPLLGWLAVLGSGARAATETNLVYIDTSFENASPVWHDRAADGTVGVHLLYDRERASPNRAAGLNEYPSAKHWRDYGARLARVLDDYFARVNP